jgi:DNA-binding beta-propeller fold protein YncE
MEIGTLGVDLETPTNMAVDLDGTIFIANNNTGELLTVDKDTGPATVLGTIGPDFGQIGALAFTPSMCSR